MQNDEMSIHTEDGDAFQEKLVRLADKCVRACGCRVPSRAGAGQEVGREEVKYCTALRRVVRRQWVVGVEVQWR